MKQLFATQMVNAAHVTSTGQTLLHYATWMGRIDLVELILENSENIALKDKDGKKIYIYFSLIFRFLSQLFLLLFYFIWPGLFFLSFFPLFSVHFFLLVLFFSFCFSQKKNRQDCSRHYR